MSFLLNYVGRSLDGRIGLLYASFSSAIFQNASFFQSRVDRAELYEICNRGCHWQVMALSKALRSVLEIRDSQRRNKVKFRTFYPHPMQKLNELPRRRGNSPGTIPVKFYLDVNSAWPTYKMA